MSTNETEARTPTTAELHAACREFLAARDAHLVEMECVGVHDTSAERLKAAIHRHDAGRTALIDLMRDAGRRAVLCDGLVVLDVSPDHPACAWPEDFEEGVVEHLEVIPAAELLGAIVPGLLPDAAAFRRYPEDREPGCNAV